MQVSEVASVLAATGMNQNLDVFPTLQAAMAGGAPWQPPTPSPPG